MKNKLITLLTFPPLLITLMLLPFMDERMPAHYDFQGNVTRLGSRYETLIIPILIILFSIVWNWLSKKTTAKYENATDDTTKNELKQNLKIIYISEICVDCTFIIIQVYMLIAIFKQ